MNNSSVPLPIDGPRLNFVVWLTALGALAVLLWPYSAAHAQFVCTTTATDVTCTNSGTAAGGIVNTASGTNQNATTTNSGSVTGNIVAETTGGGNATTTNSGSVTASIAAETSTGGGNASANNSGNIGAGIFVGAVNGNASGTNSGSVGTTIQVTAGTGNASGTNSGRVVQSFTVVSANGNASATNSGSVGQNVEAAVSTGNASATNSGTVGKSLMAEVLAAGNASGTNSGSVGQNFEVVSSTGNASGTNSGKVGAVFEVITTTGNASATNSGTAGAVGADATTGNASGTNSGSIGTLFVVESGTGNARATNSGSVGQEIAVFAGGPGNAATLTNTNSGTILGGALLVANSGATSSLTNSGFITNTTGGPAITFTGGPDTLTLEWGSRVIGAIDLVGVHDTVNFVGGGNWFYTFNTLAGATINTNGAPFVVSGNQVAVLDPTAFALADRSLWFVTGGISQMLRDRFTGMAPGVGGGSTAMGFATPDSSGVIGQTGAAFAGIPSVAMSYASDPKPILGKAPAAVPYYDTTVWASGFGGQRIQDAFGSILAATETAYGGAIGIDRAFASNWRLGAFVGVGSGREDVAFNVQTIDTTYVYGGVYGHVDLAAQFLDFALYSGGMNNNSTRGIANNTVPSGFENATASYGGWFISPELTYGVHFPVDDYVWTPRASIRYVGGALDGFSETGSAQNLTVGQQSINDVEERIEVEFSKVMPVSFGGTFKITEYVGGIGLEQLGNPNINIVLLGQNLSFVTPGAPAAGGIVAGGGLQYRPTPNVSLFVAGEGTVMSDRSASGAVTGGARVSF